jgi:hypothetical protein
MEKQDQKSGTPPVVTDDQQAQRLDEEVAILLPILAGPLTWSQRRAVARVLHQDGDWRAKLLQLINHLQARLHAEAADPAP